MNFSTVSVTWHPYSDVISYVDWKLSVLNSPDGQIDDAMTVSLYSGIINTENIVKGFDLRHAAVMWFSKPQGVPSGVWTGQRNPQDLNA